jgi:hypothetical protein
MLWDANPTMADYLPVFVQGYVAIQNIVKQ